MLRIFVELVCHHWDGSTIIVGGALGGRWNGQEHEKHSPIVQWLDEDGTGSLLSELSEVNLGEDLGSSNRPAGGYSFGSLLPQIQGILVEIRF
jgi:hypothetical protein